jgi:23S rRNA (adenine2503-C2)-methyltransferase
MQSEKKKTLIGMTLNEIREAIDTLGMPAYTAREIALWIYRKGATTINEMTNISKANRSNLNEVFETGRTNPVKVSVSADGTKKYLYSAKEENGYVETAYIPEKKRSTLCVSSQVGCKLGCLFCMTARQGFQAQLSAGEIVNQVLSLPEKDALTNIVYMGMGEPFDNTGQVLKSLELLTADYGVGLSPRKITVSTVGLIPGMKEFLEKSQCHLAISLHTPFDDERASLMPVQNVYPIADVINTVRIFDFGRQRRVSFEYILFEGLNDSDAHVKKLSRLFDGLRCRVNLLRFHEIPGAPLKGATDTGLIRFRDKLNEKGIVATIRASRGEDILAACGMLSTRELNMKNKAVI